LPKYELRVGSAGCGVTLASIGRQVILALQIFGKCAQLIVTVRRNNGRFTCHKHGLSPSSEKLDSSDFLDTAAILVASWREFNTLCVVALLGLACG
jgi:hypothetical protein